MSHSTAYEEGKKAFFDGYNESDVTKFYPEGGKQAAEWLAGLKDAEKEIKLP